MSKSTIWKKNFTSRTEKETLDKNQRDIFDSTDVNLYKEDCIENLKPNDSLFCISVVPIPKEIFLFHHLHK